MVVEVTQKSELRTTNPASGELESMPSKAAVHRLVTATLAGLRPPALTRSLERPHILRKHWYQVRLSAEDYLTLAPTCVVVLSIKLRITRYVTSPIKMCQRK
jgi:hypothetical protein